MSLRQITNKHRNTSETEATVGKSTIVTLKGIPSRLISHPPSFVVLLIRIPAICQNIFSQHRHHLHSVEPQTAPLLTTFLALQSVQWPMIYFASGCYLLSGLEATSLTSLLIYRSCAALRALKRHQLVSLSKKYGLKASGKVCVHEPNSICGRYVSLSQS